MPDVPRYAIYFVPDPSSALWAFGSAAIGYDSAAARDVPFPAHNFYKCAGIRDWTADPRRYGFHATLKAPFRLKDGAALAELLEAAQEFAATETPLTIPRLEVATVGSFAALVPAAPVPAVDELAMRCVEAFDAMRAPLTQDERKRRARARLTARQAEHLERWGYPYVADEFRFHLTLTGKVPTAILERAATALRQLYAPLSAPLRIDSIAVCEQASQAGRFTVLRRFPFAA